MRLRLLLLTGAVLLLIGCAAVEPARVENGLYIHPAYAFSLRLPAGWECSEDLPQLVEKGMSFVSRRNFKATFSNPRKKGFILVFAEKTTADWVSFTMNRDRFMTSLDRYYSREKSKQSRNKHIHSYRYELYRDRVEACDGGCVASKIEFQAGDIRAIGHNILYRGPGGMLDTVSLILMAREEHYDALLGPFRSVLNSFEAL